MGTYKYETAFSYLLLIKHESGINEYIRSETVAMYFSHFLFTLAHITITQSSFTMTRVVRSAVLHGADTLELPGILAVNKIEYIYM